jgi:diaminohydroxyphosphoribosylaminopyrimidine deaminase/5-amino-6-(5-phosphoribosylamino)uracil reductase
MSKSTSKTKAVRGPQLESGFSFGGPQRSLTFPKGTDRYWMLEALRESLQGIGITNPNPAVGCIIVDSAGNEISRGATRTYGREHAERVAFQKAQECLPEGLPERLKTATIYVTLEPCSHQGHQPPCVDLLTSSPIQRVVIARLDPNPLVAGQGVKKLLAAGKEVEVGLFADEASAWNFTFFAQQVLKRPTIVLKWAQTLDGQLADDASHSQWITGAEARAYTHWLRQRYDAILVGAATVLADLPRLDVRDCPPPHQHNPLPIILDPRGICLGVSRSVQRELGTRTFGPPERRVIYITTRTALRKNPASWLTKMKNVIVLQIPGKQPINEVTQLFAGPEIADVLGHPLQSVLVEGGPRTLTSFIEANAADLLHVFIAPILTGGHKHRIQTERLLKKAQKFSLISTTQLGNDVVLEMVSPEAAEKVFGRRKTT